VTWLSETQYRPQYSTDDRNGVAWQQTAVWRDIASHRSLSVEEWVDCLLFFAAATITIVAYNFVSSIGFVEHLSNCLRGTLLIGTMTISFIGSVKFLYSEIVKALVQFVVCGLFTLCVGAIVVSVIWHFL